MQRTRKKNPCTKKVFERWLKSLGKSCAYCVFKGETGMAADLSQVTQGELEKLSDIVGDSVNSELSFLGEGQNYPWYAIEKLEVNPRAVEAVLCDLVFIEAEKFLAILKRRK